VTLELSAVRFGARDPQALSRFWAGVLQWGAMPSVDGDVVVRGDDSSFALRFTPNDVVKTKQNRIHLDLTSQSPADQQAIVERALALGGRHLDIGQTPDDDHVVLADPEGNELCVIEPGNGFLAGCGRIGAVNCDGTQALGYFWSQALGWPLVWDQDEETAVQSPRGGSKVTWSGPPLMPREGTTPIELELTARDGDLRAEVERLVGLGASVEQEPSADGRVVLLDPDGNRFGVRLPG
jgi:catechol 2,3-dioxygenase-like lactoylglutathione lyase family enzyme